ncbi:serine/threonine-protein kinase [Parafrankia sp. FMc6]|uniref:serine/threonine-protein kinase n=1 Tax=Parafrankia soli TaxID=2599596 RepID=UPI0034D68235
MPRDGGSSGPGPAEMIGSTGSIVAGRVVAGRYRLIECVGAGSMGTVWRALDVLLRAEVAVKAIWIGGRAGAPGPDGADPQRLAAAVREARNAAQLRANPHVVSVTDVIQDGGLPWIVMELVAATSLDTAVRRGGPLPPRRVAEIGLAVLDALTAGQRVGLLHRDVKPSNILLADDGRVLLTDFGIATNVADTTDAGASGSAGTPAYLAPERITRGPASLAADLFSLGATLYFAAGGIPPFARETVPLTLGAVLHVDPPALTDTDALWPAIGGLLVKNPQARLSAEGAEVLLARVLRLVPGEPDNAAARPSTTRPPTEPPAARPARRQTAAPPTAGSAPRPVPPARPVPAPWPVPLPDGPRRRRPLVALAAGVGLVLVLVAAGLLWAARDERPPSTAGPPSAADLLPAGMAGTWVGSVTQGPIEFGVEIVLRRGGIGEIVGDSDYPTDGCAARLRLLEAGADRVTVQERLFRSGALCRGAERLVLALRPDGRLAYTFSATNINSTGTGVLTRR